MLKDLTKEILNDLFIDNGIHLIWRQDNKYNKVKGKIAGYLNMGKNRKPRWVIRINGKLYERKALIKIMKPWEN